METNNPKQVKPDLSEWGKQNPGKTINDYFKIYGTDTYSQNTNRYSSDYVSAPFKNELIQKKNQL